MASRVNWYSLCADWIITNEIYKYQLFMSFNNKKELYDTFPILYVLDDDIQLNANLLIIEEFNAAVRTNILTIEPSIDSMGNVTNRTYYVKIKLFEEGERAVSLAGFKNLEKQPHESGVISNCYYTMPDIYLTLSPLFKKRLKEHLIKSNAIGELRYIKARLITYFTAVVKFADFIANNFESRGRIRR